MTLGEGRQFILWAALGWTAVMTLVAVGAGDSWAALVAAWIGLAAITIALASWTFRIEIKGRDDA